ncbi:MAG: outer membrane beta-barrel protein [Cyclobacteriaceae bacterium]|nr:outer membrane beta-barrel protein [Cyclobacteriaceae bacterium]
MNLAPLFRSFMLISTLLLSYLQAAGQEVYSLGVFTGFTIPYTWDEGINKDPRYRIKYNLKFAPIGVHYGVDRQGFGFTFDPSVFVTGQNFNVINTSGGDVGERNIDLTFINVPVGFKLHMIDMSFFKVSFVASAGVSYMMSGKETITHMDSKLTFPPQAYPNLPPDYIVEYDGVLVPNIKNLELINKSDFNQLQVYGAIGFRSDWDISENYRISFDLRGCYGIFDPRKQTYIDKVNAYEAIYDLPGNRRDMFAYITVGISKIVEIDSKEKLAKVKQRSMSQKGPVQSKYQHLHNSKSKKKHSPPKN